ncbi:MAG: NAD(P)H-hydrate dehydratase [Actinobacteria bacterium]|nr:NAD(P)H-hydrate dehydratase [Actinomycetota bacterium]
MSGHVEPLSARMLRDWPLPQGGSTKYERGAILVVGGAVRTPGAVQLTGLAALRVGAGRLTMAVAEPVAVALAVATPEAGVTGLPVDAEGNVDGEDLSALGHDLSVADAVVVGPGLGGKEPTARLLRALLPMLGAETQLVLDAFALGVLPEMRDVLPDYEGRIVLTPNDTEAGLLLGRPLDDVELDVPELARTYHAVVTCHDLVCEPNGRSWRIEVGHSGLATSGSGDVLAGAVGGFVARGATPAQATCWAKYVHANAGERLAARVGRKGFLAREIVDELPTVMTELDA